MKIASKISYFKKIMGYEDRLLEGLELNDKGNLLAWVDILRKRIFLKDLVSFKTTVYRYPYIVSNIFEVSDEKAVLLDDHGIAEFFWSDQSVVRVFDMAKQLVDAGFRGNDGVKLAEKKFLFGSMHKEKPIENIGAVWLLDDDRLTRISENFIPNLFVRIGNSILITDSYKKVIFYHSASTGLMEGIWADRSQLAGEPDGGCLSQDGYVYIANWGMGEILKYSLGGCLIKSRRVSALQPSCCRINNGKLWITTAAVQITEQASREYPDSGKLIELDVF